MPTQFSVEKQSSKDSIPNYENQVLYFMIMKDSLPLVEVNYLLEGTQYNSVLLSGFISALDSFSQNLTKNEVKVIDQGNVKIALEKGSVVSAIYMVNKVTSEIKKKVQKLVNTFESRYEALLKQRVFDTSLCEEFQEYIGNILALETVKSYYIPKYAIKIQEFDNSANLIPQDMILILSNINGKNSVEEISKSVKKDYNSVLEDLAWLRSKKIIEFDIKVDPFDIPIIVPKGVKALMKTSIEWHALKSQFGENVLEVLKVINGTNTIQELIQKSLINKTVGLNLFKTLIANEFIQLVPEEVKTCLILEHLYKFLNDTLIKLLGHKSKGFIENSLRETKNEYFGLITFEDNGKPSFEMLKIHLSGKNAIDNDKLFKMFLSPLPDIFQTLKTKLGENYTTKIKKSLHKEMRDQMNVNDLEDILESI